MVCECKRLYLCAGIPKLYIRPLILCVMDKKFKKDDQAVFESSAKNRIWHWSIPLNKEGACREFQKRWMCNGKILLGTKVQLELPFSNT